MVNIKGETVFLRALEPEDLDFVYEVENSQEFWEYSETLTPYSRYIIKRYLENATQDIFEAKQLRLAICKKDHQIIGLIDVFDFNPINKRAGLGILIKNSNDRRNGYAKEALSLLIHYCFQTLHLHQIYANIAASNQVSLSLFENQGFKKIGLKKDWRYDGTKYHDEYLLQKIKS